MELAHMNKLNPRSPSMEPPATDTSNEVIRPSDVAAALGFVKREIQRQLLCAYYAPHMCQRHQIVGIMLKILTDKSKRMWVDNESMSLDLLIAREMSSPDRVKQLESKYEREHKKVWPRPSADNKYTMLILAVLDEFIRPDICYVCDGKGKVEAKSKAKKDEGKDIYVQKTCGRCNGSGKDHFSKSDNYRAGQMHMLRNNFLKTWHGVYVYTLNYFKTQFYQGLDVIKEELYRH